MDKLTTTNSDISRRKFVIGSARAAASLPAVAMAAFLLFVIKMGLEQ